MQGDTGVPAQMQGDMQGESGVPAHLSRARVHKTSTRLRLECALLWGHNWEVPRRYFEIPEAVLRATAPVSRVRVLQMGRSFIHKVCTHCGYRKTFEPSQLNRVTHQFD